MSVTFASVSNNGNISTDRHPFHCLVLSLTLFQSYSIQKSFIWLCNKVENDTETVLNLKLSARSQHDRKLKHVSIIIMRILFFSVDERVERTRRQRHQATAALPRDFLHDPSNHPHQLRLRPDDITE